MFGSVFRARGGNLGFEPSNLHCGAVIIEADTDAVERALGLRKLAKSSNFEFAAAFPPKNGAGYEARRHSRRSSPFYYNMTKRGTG